MKTFSSFLSTLLVLLATTFIVPAYSRIHSISAPTTILHPGQKFNVTFHTNLFIQNNLQFYAVFGIRPSPGYDGPYVGDPVPAVAPVPGADGGDYGGINLFRAGLGGSDYNVTLKLPSDVGTKNKVTEYVIKTGVLGNVGASGLTELTFYSATVRIKA